MAICFVCNALFEWIQRLYGLGHAAYRLLIFRYMLLIAFGCYVCVGKSVPKKWIVFVSMIAGAAYIWLYCYYGYEPKVIIYWSGTSFIAALYIMPVIGKLLLSPKCRKVGCKPLEILGKASYNIFLTQMVYYSYMAADIYSLKLPRIVLLMITIVICVAAGTAFYFIESRITSHLLKRLHEREDKFVFQKVLQTINRKMTIPKRLEKEETGKMQTDTR